MTNISPGVSLGSLGEMYPYGTRAGGLTRISVPYVYLAANGNRTGLNLVGTGLFTYTYDSLNRLTTAQKPGNALYTMAYDNDSRRTTMTLGNGTTRRYQFDNRSQLTTQIEANGATNLCTIIDGYDPVGNRVTRNLDGNPITWIYDDLCRLSVKLSFCSKGPGIRQNRRSG